VKGQDLDDSWEDAFEELDVTVDAIVRFLELRTED